MKKILFVLVLFVVSIIFIQTTSLIAHSKNYPNKMVTAVIPFAPGGGSDRWVRALSTVAVDHYGQPFHPVNIAGAQTKIAWQHILKQPPDGYTFMKGSDTGIIALLMEDHPPFSPLDIEIAAIISKWSAMVGARPGAPWDTWEKFVKYAKENPGKLNLGGTVGTLLGSSYLFKQVGIELNYIPYGSTGETITDFLGGHIDIVTGSGAAIAPLVSDGRVAALVNTSEIKYEDETAWKDVPNAVDLGYSGLDFLYWIGFHPKTPEDILQYASDAFEKILTDRSFKSIIDRLGEKVMYVPRESAMETFKKSVEKLSEALKDLKL